jgi:hypothetical protein
MFAGCWWMWWWGYGAESCFKTCHLLSWSRNSWQLWNADVHYRSPKSPVLKRVLIHMNRSTSYFFHIHLNFISLLYIGLLKFPNWSLPFLFSIHIFFTSHMRATCPTIIILLHLIKLLIFLKRTNYGVPHYAIYVNHLILIYSQNILRIVFWNFFNLYINVLWLNWWRGRKSDIYKRGFCLTILIFQCFGLCMPLFYFKWAGPAWRSKRFHLLFSHFFSEG